MATQNVQKLTITKNGDTYVLDTSDKAPLNSPSFTGAPTAPTATQGTNTTQIATTEFVNAAFQANDAMVFKGTIGDSASGATVTELPANHKKGWTYRVVTAGTYAGQPCEISDMIICVTNGTSANNNHWTVVQSNIDGAVIGPASSTNAHVATFNGVTGKLIQDSGYTIGKSVPSDAVFTDTTYENATQSVAGLMSSTDKTKLDDLGVISTDIDITVPVSGWTVSNNEYVYTWTNSNVKTNSDVQVFFRTGSEDSVLEYIEYAKVTGGVQLKTNRLAEADLPLTIRILDMEQNTGNSINASAVSTSAISGLDTVEEVLDELADRTEVFTGATMSSAGEAGIVPAPDQRGYGTAPGKFLSDDGTWKNLYDEIGLSKATSVAYGPITKEMLSFKTTNRKSENQPYTMGQIKLDASDKAQFSFREVSKSSSTGLNNGVSETYNLPAADDDLAAAKSYDILTTKNANGSVIPVSSTDNTTIASAVSTLNNNLTTLSGQFANHSNRFRNFTLGSGESITLIMGVMLVFFDAYGPNLVFVKSDGTKTVLHETAQGGTNYLVTSKSGSTYTLKNNLGWGMPIAIITLNA